MPHNEGALADIFDLIVAPITAVGGAVGIVRVSGEGAWALAQQVCQGLPTDLVSHKAYRATFSNGDDGLVLPFEHGKSFTGEESVEFNLHGSSISITSFVEALVAHGARLARPGEFTERAFLNGRLDLTQAEAVNDTVRAVSERQLGLANELREGALSSEVLQLSDSLAKVLAAIEASVDFSEEVGDVDVDVAQATLSQAKSTLSSLISRGERGRVIREGLRIAIVGPPNAGKSSLLNRLLGVQRAIVTPIAGTTRDYVEETIVLAGIPCVLIDTAGLRESNDEVESIGIQRARAQAANATIVWFVYDASIGLTKIDREELDSFGTNVLLVANKSDLATSHEGIAISTYTGDGLAQLVGTIESLTTDLSGAIPNARHLGHLQNAAESIEQAQLGFE
ncbi:MAG TPA: tRNA uridine-5-carboxymethylaminomethyl(34) synthesis GTPase MnmE, partial [Fimbriimonas sp.]|nr:tRNA uridine-5-carboxymethylaminomethyl(34) synthesis GTPase MnmE [Fimbriimonas sp.]